MDIEKEKLENLNWLKTEVNKLCRNFTLENPMTRNASWNKYIELYSKVGHFVSIPPENLLFKMEQKEEEEFLVKTREIISKLTITYRNHLKNFRKSS